MWNIRSDQWFNAWVKEADRRAVVGHAEAHVWAAFEATGDVGADKPLESGRVHDVPAQPPAERARPVEARRAEHVAEDACTPQINRIVQKIVLPPIDLLVELMITNSSQGVCHQFEDQ